MRGSLHAISASAAKRPSASNAVPAAAQPATSGRSRFISASYMRRPSPGHAVTSSTTNEPLSSAPNASPPTPATGLSDSRHA